MMNTRIKSCAIVVLTTMFVFIFTISVHAQTVLRVDIENGSVNGDGTAWGSAAFKFLQDALDEAADLAQFGLVDIWVTEGVYKPDHDSSNPNGSCQGSAPFIICDPEATFTIPNNVRIFGGFNKTNPENSLADRTHDPSKTILTGDLADGNSSQSSAYSHNVVTFDTTDSTARLDTVTIKGGFRASVLIYRSSAIISNTIIIESGARGVLVQGSATPRLINCRLISSHPGGPSSGKSEN